MGFEIRGVSEEILKRCSRRREQIDKAIEAFVKTHGRQPNIDEVGQLTLLTRNRKMLVRSNAQVKDFKLAMFTEEEKAHFKEMCSRAYQRGAMLAPWLSDEARLAAIQKVAAQLFERESVITEDKLLAEVLNQNLGKVRLEDLKKDAASLTELVNLGEPSANPYITTREHMNREAEILKLAAQLRDIELPLKSDYKPFSELPDGFDHSAQTSVIEHILESKSKFQIFRGVAGAGKTSTLQELCKCLKHAGIGNIHLIAPTNSAVDVLRSEGFGSAQTVAKFLIDPQQLPPDGSYLIVDESGLNSVRQGYDMMRLALQHDYRILFVGDERQHSSVEAGDFFRLLENYSEIDKTELAEIHRQQDEEYRRGILLAASGDAGSAFDQLDSHGFIHENRGTYLDAAAESFLRLTEDGSRPLDCIAVSPTNRECELLTEKIRAKMKSKDVLDADTERQVEAFRSWSWTAEKIGDTAHYKPGMQIFLTSKIKGIGNAGEMFQVEKIEGKKLFLSNGQWVNPRQFKDRIDAGEKRELSVAKGDILRFTVNLKTPEGKINNGSLAVATGRPNEFILLDHNRKELKQIRLPEGFRGLKYGWVITSHSSQGMTSKNVVVAAEKMSAQAFYVACSRGRKNLSLHVPEKEFFKDRLVKIPTERKLVTDVLGAPSPWRAPVIPPPPDVLIGSKLRQFMDRTLEQMRKVQKIVAGYIRNAMYHAFNHNIRTRDHERNERIRKQFREKYAIFKRENAERERLAAEHAKIEQAKPFSEQSPAAQAKIEPRPVPESPFEAAKRIAAERIAAAERAMAEKMRQNAERTRNEAASRRVVPEPEQSKLAPEQTPVVQPRFEPRPVPKNPFDAAKRIAAEWEKRAYEQVRYKPEQANAEPARSESEHGNPEPERAKPKSEPVSSERTETAAAKRKLERSQSKTSLRDRLVALAEQRKRESSRGLDR